TRLDRLVHSCATALAPGCADVGTTGTPRSVAMKPESVLALPVCGDGDREGLVGGAAERAARRRHVGIVPPARHLDVVRVCHHVVGGIETPPAMTGREGFHPRVRGAPTAMWRHRRIIRAMGSLQSITRAA